MIRKSIRSTLLMLSVALIASHSYGQDKAQSREREALRRAQQQLQQLRQEKSSVDEKLAATEQEKAKLVKDNESLAQAKTGIERERQRILGQVSQSEKRAREEAVKLQQLQTSFDAANQERQAIAAQKANLEARVIELNAENAATERDLARITATGSLAQASLNTRDKELATCEGKNVQLYAHGRNLIDQCRDRSATDAVLRLEPFTGIRRVALENTLEEYRDKLDTQKLISGTPQK